MVVLGAIMSIQIGQKPPRRRSILFWGAAAATAVVFSYLLTLALGLGCLAIPVVVIGMIAKGQTSAMVAQLLLGAFGLVAGCSILWALVPRRIPFQAPGATIDLATQPRLRAEVEAIARALDEPMPTDVYLIADANAFVAQPGGGRKILALGLPLMQTLTVAEMRALLAHEFAHFYSGDTRLGPWVYRGRSTMVRVFQNLGKRSQLLGVLLRWAVVALAYRALIWILQTYWKLFLRLTQLISRRQEFRSDEIACYVAGSDSLASALESINRSGAVVASYWNGVVAPMAARGYQPQLGESFAQFLAAPNIAKAAAEAVEKRMASTKSDPFDTHPPLSARIAQARRIDVVAAGEEAGKAPAISLLDDVPVLERELLHKLLPKLDMAAMKPLVWETSAAEVFVPHWRKEVEPFAAVLAGTTLATLPALVKAPQAVAAKVMNPPGILLNKQKKEARALEILRMALALSLIDHGWTLHASPAQAYMERESVRVVAAEVVGKLKAGTMAESEWAEFCNTNRIGEWPLAMSQVDEPVKV